MTHPLILLAFGILVGVFSGLMGLGGGSIMIPIMVLLFGFTQARSHAMSLLVMIPPVTLPAVIGYWRNGFLSKDDLWIAAMIAAGVLLGSYFGSQIAVMLQHHKGLLRLVFGFLLIYVAGYTAFSWFGRDHVLRSVVMAGIIVAFAVGLFFAVKLWDQSHPRANSVADVNDSIAENL